MLLPSDMQFKHVIDTVFYLDYRGKLTYNYQKILSVDQYILNLTFMYEVVQKIFNWCESHFKIIIGT